MIAVSVFNHPVIHRHLSLGRIFNFHSIYEPNPKFKSPSCSRASKRHQCVFKITAADTRFSHFCPIFSKVSRGKSLKWKFPKCSIKI